MVLNFLYILRRHSQHPLSTEEEIEGCRVLFQQMESASYKIVPQALPRRNSATTNVDKDGGCAGYLCADVESLAYIFKKNDV